jgi:putative flippase GtrA
VVRFGLRSARFAAASLIGFLVTELVLSLGLFALYGRFTLPRTTFPAAGLIVLDVVSLTVGVSVSFLINERMTFRPHDLEAVGSRSARYLKFQAVCWTGNLGIIAIQFLLLAALGVSPVLGELAGTVITFPLVYLISTRSVWRAYEAR